MVRLSEKIDNPWSTDHIHYHVVWLRKQFLSDYVHDRAHDCVSQSFCRILQA